MNEKGLGYEDGYRRLADNETVMENERSIVAPIVAWDIYERRLYGAPGEVRHRVLWVDDYRLEDGTSPDLDELLDAARKSELDPGAKTIYVKPLMFVPMTDQEGYPYPREG